MQIFYNSLPVAFAISFKEQNKVNRIIILTHLTLTIQNCKPHHRNNLKKWKEFDLLKIINISKKPNSIRFKISLKTK